MKTFETTNCNNCNKEFEKRTYNQMVCSLECKNILRNNKRRKNVFLTNCNSCNKEFISNGNKKSCNKECQAKHSKKLREQKNKEYRKNYKKNYRVGHKEEISYYMHNWRNSNKESFKIKYNNDINLRLTIGIRRYLRRMLKGSVKYDHTIGYINYTTEDLKSYIESLWSENMSWENYGLHGWHIDHIKPIALFNFIGRDGLLDAEKIKECMALSNLQPLWAKDNLSKGKKYYLIKEVI